MFCSSPLTSSLRENRKLSIFKPTGRPRAGVRKRRRGNHGGGGMGGRGGVGSLPRSAPADRGAPWGGAGAGPAGQVDSRASAVSRARSPPASAHRDPLFSRPRDPCLPGPRRAAWRPPRSSRAGSCSWRLRRRWAQPRKVRARAAAGGGRSGAGPEARRRGRRAEWPPRGSGAQPAPPPGCSDLGRQERSLRGGDRPARTPAPAPDVAAGGDR